MTAQEKRKFPPAQELSDMAEPDYSKALGRIAQATLLLIIMGVISALWPTIIVEDEHAAATTLKTALGIYRDRHGVNPRDLRDLCPIIREMQYENCRVAEQGLNTSEIEFGVQEKFWRVVLEYATADGTRLDRFHVVSIQTVHR